MSRCSPFIFGVGCYGSGGGGGGGATLTIEVYLNAGLTIPYVDGVDFQDDIWIHINTDLTSPTEYRFLIFDNGLDGTHAVQAGDTLQWYVRAFTDILIYAEAVNGSSAACALAAFEVEINSDDDANAYIAAHNALSGMTMGAIQQTAIQGTFQRFKGTGTTYGSDLWTLFKNSGTRIFGYTPVDDSTVNTLAYGLDMIQLASQTFHGFIPADFTVTGLKGGVSKYTKTGMYATSFDINELGGSVYIRENTPTGSVFGATDGTSFFTGTNGMLLFIRLIAQNQVVVRSNGLYGYISPFATRTGLIAMQRTSSSLVGAYRNGVLIDTVSVSVSSQNAGEIYGHACNNNGTNGDNYTGEIAWLCPAMPRLTANQMADYYEAVKYYQENIITGGRHVV